MGGYKTIVIVNMVHFKPGGHARSSQFIWHFDLDCSWDSIEGLPCIQKDDADFDTAWSY
jgi:hypothetical protein